VAVIADAQSQEVASVAENAFVVTKDLADKVDALALSDNIADALDDGVCAARSRVLPLAIFKHRFLVGTHDAQHLFFNIGKLFFMLFFDRFWIAVISCVFVFFRLEFFNDFFGFFGEGFEFACGNGNSFFFGDEFI
jgi:hypothetical protein